MVPASLPIAELMDQIRRAFDDAVIGRDEAVRQLRILAPRTTDAEADDLLTDPVWPVARYFEQFEKAQVTQ